MGKKIIILSCYLCLLMVASPGFAQEYMSGLRCGKLPNGLTYYVKHSALQKGQVSFYLLQNVGAILEEDSENGLAHFLEHMAFNGSEHFPGGVMPYLKGKGIYTFNASTAVNETVYHIDDIPVADSGLTDSCLLIVKDWCNGLLLREKDIEDERGVIMEEWRGRSDVERRILTALAPHVYNNSKYASRNVIGSFDVLQSFSPETLRTFYHTWYRPDLQCVIVVGDIDESDFEAQIKKVFLGIPAVENPKERYKVEIPENDQLAWCRFVDKENKVNSITLYKRVPSMHTSDGDQYRKGQLLAKLFNRLMKQRFARVRNDNREQYISASVEYDAFVRGMNCITLNVIPFAGKDREAFSQAWQLWFETCKLGFSEQEFIRELEALYQEVKELERNLDKNTNNYYFMAFRRHFLHNLPVCDLEDEVRSTLSILLELELDDINNWLVGKNDNRNLTMLVTGSDENYPYLGCDEAIGIMNAADHEDVWRESKVEISDFFDIDLSPGKIVRTKRLKAFDAEIWTLSNGARVVYKYVENGRGTFAFAANSYGGSSVVADEDLPSLRAMQNLVLKSGLYKYDRNALLDLLSGKSIDLNLIINEYTEGMGGTARTEDAELFFQYLYLMFEKPLFTREQFDKYIQRTKYILENTPKTAMELVADSIRQLTVKATPRNREFNVDYLGEMVFDRIEPLYRGRFGNAADFTFCIVGDIPAEEASGLACRYLATLPAKRKIRKERFVLRDESLKTPRLVKEFKVEMPDSRGMVEITYSNDLKLKDKEDMAFRVLGLILRNRYFEEIREREGGTYGVDVQTATSVSPIRSQELRIAFQTENVKADYLKQMIYDDITRICTELPGENEMNSVLMSMKMENKRADEEKGIQYWMSVLNIYIEYGQDITDPDHFDRLISGLKPADISNITRKFLEKARLKDIVIKSD